MSARHDPRTKLELQIRRFTGCQSLKYDDSFEILLILPQHDSNEKGKYAIIDFSFSVYGTYGEAQIRNRCFDLFDCDRSLSDKQERYIKTWLMLIFDVSYPVVREEQRERNA